MAVNPDIQQKLYLEITNSNCLDAPGLDHLNDLPYLDMVIAETLRLYPVAHVVDRLTRKDITINGLCIPKGMMIGIPIYSLHRKLWPDPEKFIPERFTPEQKAKRQSCSYLPFGTGPRNCIGTRLAILEVKAAMVKILSQVEFVTTEETEIPLPLKTTTVLMPARPIYLSIRPRH